MRRLKGLLVAIILVVGILFPTTTLANPGVTVSISDVGLAAGATGSVALTISGVSDDRPVSCITVDVSYDPLVVEVLDASNSDFAGFVNNIQNPDGYTRLVAYVTSPTGLTGTIRVADISLKRLSGESELALDVITLKDDGGQSIPFTVDNGRVTADILPPTVTSTSPADGATGVAITATVRATFSEAINEGTISFSLDGVAGSVTYTDTTATFTPGANLGYSRTYTASVSASDLAGNPMAVAYSWSFTTRAEPGVTDDTPPTVTSTSPANGATGVAITARVRATFSEVIDSGTLAFSVGGVSGATTYTGTTATFTPSANLRYSRRYTASVSASDLAGNPMAAYSWSFTTRAAPVVVGGGGGGGGRYEPPAPPPGTTDVSGKVTTTGVFTSSTTATSEDELCTLTIPRDTVGLTEELEPLDEITMVIMDDPPPPPKDAYIVGLAYDFGPDGATFDPPITLEFSYDPADIPEGIAEEDLVLAMWDEELGEWVELEGCVVDPVTHTITASVSHFTTFAVIAWRPVPPPPPPAPAPAAFSVSNLSIKPAEVKSKEAVTITVSVANTGGMEGSYTAVLKINGVKEVEKRVTLAAGSTEMWLLFVEREEVGSYSVTVDGLSGSFAVVAPPAPPPAPPEVKPPVVPPVKPPFNWPLVGGIIAVVLLALILYLVRRRASKLSEPNSPE